MRIVGGGLRGRRLASLKGTDLRPTSDRVREAVFNIIEHGPDYPEIPGASVADLFAGTGAYGLEAMSRGAAHATFIDNDMQAVAVIRRNSAHLGLERQTTLLKLDASRL
ncbi:MAG: RsmD family RNA methyltransferase, partial [Rhodospirillales bacterium]